MIAISKRMIFEKKIFVPWNFKSTLIICRKIVCRISFVRHFELEKDIFVFVKKKKRFLITIKNKIFFIFCLFYLYDIFKNTKTF